MKSNLHVKPLLPTYIILQLKNIIERHLPVLKGFFWQPGIGVIPLRQRFTEPCEFHFRCTFPYTCITLNFGLKLIIKIMQLY